MVRLFHPVFAAGVFIAAGEDGDEGNSIFAQ